MGLGTSQRGGRRSRQAPMSEINVTPLVDVMLVLLIIFMITAPLLVAGVPIDLPDNRAAPLQSDDTPIQISVDEEGRIFIDEQEQQADSFAARLGAIYQARQGGPEEPRVYIRADRGLDYGLVMGVLGEVNRAGFRRVALVSEGTGEAPAASGGE
ncbi:protein TolR [Pacificimonas flava]|uniref:Protein TolR n=2 Tax=Pacificimonas TaxID=1960290 RepID=A0A219B8L3_9SPHN|nr:protein TolR [Pacificimonas flava]